MTAAATLAAVDVPSSAECRVITWTKSRGVCDVSPGMDRDEAFELARLLVEANPVWLGVDVELVHHDGTSTLLRRDAWQVKP